MLIPMWMAACSSDDTQGDAEGNPVAEESQDVKDYANGTPWQDIDLDGVVTEDTPVDVKDNFALYANKDDILSLKILKDSGVAMGNASDEVKKSADYVTDSVDENGIENALRHFHLID